MQTGKCSFSRCLDRGRSTICETSMVYEAIPTQVFLDKDGKEYFRHVGYFPEEDVVTILKMKGVK